MKIRIKNQPGTEGRGYDTLVFAVDEQGQEHPLEGVTQVLFHARSSRAINHAWIQFGDFEGTCEIDALADVSEASCAQVREQVERFGEPQVLPIAPVPEA